MQLDELELDGLETWLLTAEARLGFDVEKLQDLGDSEGAR